MRVDKHWPKLEDTALLGKRNTRIDGPDKVQGAAKYTFDINRPGMLFAKYTLCPHGHARVTKVDVGPAKAMKGVLYAQATRNPDSKSGAEVHYAGDHVAVVAAETEEIAREAARRVVVEYEVLDHNVADRDYESVDAKWRKAGNERVKGEVEAAMDGEVSEGEYGCAIITHCCLESHGLVIEIGDDDKVTAWVSTQSVSGVGEQIAGMIGVDRGDVHVICQHLGGGFGSKFGADAGPQACEIASATKRPVKLMFERDQELMIAGSRPSGFARVKVGVAKDGEIKAWSSESWGTDGPQGRSRLTLPYLFSKIGATRHVHNNLMTHTGPARAWRAPSHPQQALITMAALEDAAAKIGMDPLEFFLKNLGFTDRPDVYAEELKIAADLIGWKDKWKPRGSQTGSIRRGLGLSIHTWGGGGHESNNQTTIRSDGAVETLCATQDLGVGTRTSIAIVVAETMGLPIDAITVGIGDDRYPQSGASGGSTTIGGISTAARTAAVAALNQLVTKVAKELGAKEDDLVAKGGRIHVASDPAKGMAWKDACRLIGPTPIVGKGSTDSDLNSSDVGGAQMAEVELDVETGQVRMKTMVAVQDCGTIVNLMAAESQVYGACIMGITSALYEERVMDPATGACLNPDLEFYRLAGIGDVGEIKVHMMQTPAHHGRGVIGLGEPPVVSPLAAISNAVANAAGVRVPCAPFTPREVLRALGKGGA